MNLWFNVPDGHIGEYELKYGKDVLALGNFFADGYMVMQAMGNEHKYNHPVVRLAGRTLIVGKKM